MLIVSFYFSSENLNDSQKLSLVNFLIKGVSNHT